MKFVEKLEKCENCREQRRKTESEAGKSINFFLCLNILFALTPIFNSHRIPSHQSFNRKFFNFSPRSNHIDETRRKREKVFHFRCCLSVEYRRNWNEFVICATCSEFCWWVSFFPITEYILISLMSSRWWEWRILMENWHAHFNLLRSSYNSWMNAEWARKWSWKKRNKKTNLKLSFHFFSASIINILFFSHRWELWKMKFSSESSIIILLLYYFISSLACWI